MSAPSIIDLLKKDHREVAKLFDQALETTQRATARRAALWAQIVSALELHMAFEEGHIYPILHAQKGTRDEAMEATAEHAQAKHLFAVGAKLAVTDERWKANVTVLAEDIRHHVHEEEQMGGLFAHLRKALDSRQLSELGEAYLAMKEAAAAPARA